MERHEVIVTGGRTYRDWKTVWEVLDAVHGFKPIDVLIHGGCSGADQLAGRWARANDVREEIYKADWDRLGKSAGPDRNLKMVWTNTSAIGVVFPGDSGTKNCLGYMVKYLDQVVVVEPTDTGWTARDGLG